MAAWLKRILPSLILDMPVVLALAFRAACMYLRWPLLAVYVALSWALFRRLSASTWILTIVRDPATRIAHGLEHATLAVLSADGLPVVRGFTHGRDRFVVVLKAGQEHQLAAVLDAAGGSIERIRAGERDLAYHPGCGTSKAVSAVLLWLVYVSSMLFSFAVGGSAPVFIAVSALLFRFWLACETALGLLAQRLFTVSTAFTQASVVDVSKTPSILGLKCPDDETWFEVVVDIQFDLSQGGLVAPGALT